MIQEAVSVRMSERAERTKRNADSVLGDLATIRANAMQLITDKEGNKVMLNFNAALKALELEGRHLAMWIDKQQLNCNGDGQVVVVRWQTD